MWKGEEIKREISYIPTEFIKPSASTCITSATYNLLRYLYKSRMRRSQFFLLKDEQKIKNDVRKIFLKKVKDRSK